MLVTTKPYEQAFPLEIPLSSTSSNSFVDTSRNLVRDFLRSVYILSPALFHASKRVFSETSTKLLATFATLNDDNGKIISVTAFALMKTR